MRLYTYVFWCIDNGSHGAHTSAQEFTMSLGHPVELSRMSVVPRRINQIFIDLLIQLLLRVRLWCRVTCTFPCIILCRHLPNHSRNARINSPKYVPLLRRIQVLYATVRVLYRDLVFAKLVHRKHMIICYIPVVSYCQRVELCEK